MGVKNPVVFKAVKSISPSQKGSLENSQLFSFAKRVLVGHFGTFTALPSKIE
jgi:hypothetical protein